MFALRRKEYRFLSRLFLPLKSGITLLLSPGNCRRSPTSKNLSFPPPPPELVHPSRSRAFFFAFRSITDQQIEQSTASEKRSVKNRRARRVRSPSREIARNTREMSWQAGGGGGQNDTMIDLSTEAGMLSLLCRPSHVPATL